MMNVIYNEEVYYEIDELINRLRGLACQKDYVFRGYGKQDELFPNIIRGKDFKDIENELLCDFEKYGSNYFHATTPIDFMSYAQHFGLPTRLLDFTYNPFIALSFALHMPKGNNYKNKDDGEFYYIRYASLKENICVPLIPISDDIYNMEFSRSTYLAVKACQCIDSVSDLFSTNNFKRNVSSLIGLKATYDTVATQIKIKQHAILFVDPSQSNQRIIMQQGLFMFPYTLKEAEHLDILNRNSYVLKINKGLRKKLLAYLDTLGYNTFRLMPDLSSICEAITRKHLDERMDKQELFKNKSNR